MKTAYVTSRVLLLKIFRHMLLFYDTVYNSISILALTYNVLIIISIISENAEADSFFCFMNLMSEIRDLFIKTLDADSQCGIGKN